MNLRLQLVTADTQVHKLCRKALLALSQVDLELSVVLRATNTEYDFYIWDYDSEPTLSGEEGIPDARKAFLVGRRNLAGLQERLSGRPARVLLKPPNLFILKAFLAEILGVSPAARSGHSDDLSLAKRDRDELLQSILELNLRIQEYDQARSRFVADGLNELRAPVMSILGYSKLFVEGRLGELTADQVKVMKRIQECGQRLKQLTTSLFQSALMEGTRFQAQLQADDIRIPVERAVSEVQTVAESRGVRIITTLQPATGPISFDRALITQAFVTLLDGAARAASKGGQVNVNGFPVFWDRRASNLAENAPRIERRINASETPNSYRLEVGGTREGMVDGSKLERWIEENSSALHDEAESPPSIGFRTCRRIIDMHQGYTFVDSEGAGIVMILPMYREGCEGIVRSSDVNKSISTNLAK
jgi:signal transduction histidine kinase